MARLLICLECHIIHCLHQTFICLLLLLKPLLSLLSPCDGDGAYSFSLVMRVFIGAKYGPFNGLILLVIGICSGISIWLKLGYLVSFLGKIFFCPCESECEDHLWTSSQWREQNWEWNLEKKIEPWLYFSCYIPSHLKVLLVLK